MKHRKSPWNFCVLMLCVWVGYTHPAHGANNPVPSITSLTPASATAGAAAQTLIIKGKNFVSTSTVTYNAVAHTATYVSSTELEITLSASDQATGGTYPVVVTNPTPGGGASRSVNSPWIIPCRPSPAFHRPRPRRGQRHRPSPSTGRISSPLRRSLSCGGPHRHVRKLNRAGDHIERKRPGHARNTRGGRDQPYAGRRRLKISEFHRG